MHSFAAGFHAARHGRLMVDNPPPDYVAGYKAASQEQSAWEAGYAACLRACGYRQDAEQAAYAAYIAALRAKE